MVGVPGRSRGCLTCRKRKKGCDQARPACGQCRKGNIVCQGYPKNLTFVNYNPPPAVQTHFETIQQDVTLSVAAPIRLINQPLMNSAIDVYMFDNYWDSFFPRAIEEEKKWIPAGQVVSRWIPAGWIFEMRGHLFSDSLIRTGVQANAYLTVGKKNTEQRLHVAGMQAYSWTLKEVHRCLQNEEKREHDNVLAACKLLALYEATQGSGLNWERHALGVLRLLHIRGAARHQTGVAHALFLDARYQGVVAAIRRREPNFLIEPEWCTVPWEIEAKDFRHEIIDIMVHVPCVQSEHDNLVAGLGLVTPKRCQEFFEACKKIRVDLAAWLAKIKTRFDVDRIGLIEHGIPESFPLSNLMLANAMTMYWASMLLLNMLVLQGLRKFPIAANPIASEAETNLEITPLVMCIAKSIPYFFQPDAGSICAQSFSFPLGVALNIAAYTDVHHLSEYRMLLRAFSKGSMGLMIRKFLTSLKLLSDSSPQRMPWEEEDTDTLSYEKLQSISRKYHEEGFAIQSLVENSTHNSR